MAPTWRRTTTVVIIITIIVVIVIVAVIAEQSTASVERAQWREAQRRTPLDDDRVRSKVKVARSCVVNARLYLRARTYTAMQGSLMVSR